MIEYCLQRGWGAGAFAHIEELAKKATSKALGLNRFWDSSSRSLVKTIDTRICHDERAAVKPKTDNDWGLDGFAPLGIVEEINNFDYRDIDAVGAMWLDMFFTLQRLAEHEI